MKLIYSLVFGFTILYSSAHAIAEESETMLYELALPDIELTEKNSRTIEEISFKVACGHIEAISYIPELWNVNIVRAMSVVEEFNASSGLGVANLQLKQYRKIQKAITISVIKECKTLLNVSGSIIVGGPNGLEIQLDNRNLKLMPSKK